MSPRARQITVRALVVLASICAVLALVAGYVRHAAVNSDQFANRATVALRDDSVRALLAERITDQVVAQQRDLIAARPIIESAASSIIASRAFTGLFRSAVRDVHASVFDRNADSVTLALADVGTVLAAAVEKLQPSLAKQVRSVDKAEVVSRDLGSVGGDLTRITDNIRLLAILLALLGLACVAGALVLTHDRRRTVAELGVAIAAGGVVLVVAYAVVRSLAIDHVEGPEGRAAAGAVWDAFLGDLRTAAWILAGAGAVVAAAAASLLKPIDVGVPLRRAAGWVATEPSSTALKVVRALCFLAAGLIVILRGDDVVQLALTVIGVYLIFEGVSAILRLVYRPPLEGQELPRPHGDRRRRVVVTAIAAALVVATAGIFVGSGGATTAAPPAGDCEGHAELCDRPLDDVALAVTHNSMSVPLPGWYAALQEHPIADQLAAGIRGLQIDTHYGDRLSGGRVRTYFGSPEDLRRTAKQDGVNPDAVDAALRTRERIGFSGKGERGMYLCHTFCELGATTLASVLDDIHSFLVTHPAEVLEIVNQDYVTPEDFVAAVKKAGLDRLAYSGSTTDWPTLRDMIDSDQRVVFLAENHAGAAPWYHLAYDQILQETPYSFSKVSQLTEKAELPASCKPNRGPADAPLFLLNHWITTDPLPLPSNAAKVNAYDALLRRARECQRLRHRLPNMVAVNFYEEGDVFKVVDTLNGVR